jgi:hypothetical protein
LPTSHRGGPGSIQIQDMWDLWWTKWHWIQFAFHRLLHTHLSSWADKIGQLVADVPSGLSLTPPQETKKQLILGNIVKPMYIQRSQEQRRNLF